VIAGGIVRAQEVDLISLIQGTKQFLVPLYQRPYSWREEQLSQLWIDILAEAERLRDGEQGSGHFVGSVVLAPSPHAHASAGLAQWLVVDGQQRLTTLLLLLAAIRDHVRAADAETATRIDVEYLVNQFEKGDRRLRLLPTQADREAFRACILQLPGADVAGGIGDAYRRFKANLVAFDDPDDPNDVTRVEQVVRNRLRLVEITSERGDNVHRIFQSLNNTGLKLSQADLLRNHLFMLLPTRSEQIYEDLWLPMQRSLGPELELLIWLDEVLNDNDKVKQTEIYRAQADRLDRLDGDEDRIAAWVVGLSARAALLRLLLDPNGEKDEDVRAALRRLNEWGGQASYPVGMMLLERREQGRINSSAVAAGLLTVESFLVRRMLAGVPTNNVNRILNAVPREIGRDEDPVAALQRYLSGARRFWPPDADIRAVVRTQPFYWSGRGPQRSYVLRRIEESYGAPEPVDWVKAKATVEHVMPQKLNDAWRHALSDEAKTAGMSVDELHDSLVHTIGNLTLTALNASLANHPFEKKKEILRKGALAMNQEIIAAPQWGQAEIHARADGLAERIIRLWPGPSQTTPSDRGYDWSRLHQALALMPAGTWTTYGDLAELIGSAAQPIGNHLANEVPRDAWRVLTFDGRPSRQFRWPDSDRAESQREVLERDGVTFGPDGRAVAEQRLSARDLAVLLGWDVPADTPAVDTATVRAAAFQRQLDQSQDAATSAGIRRLLDAWREAGGHIRYGAADETTAFPTLTGPGNAHIWPLAIYPRYGSVEVVFEHLARRSPFDDPSLRRELLDRLNKAYDINLPATKLSLRPSFPITVFRQPQGADGVVAAMRWFIDTCTANPTDGWRTSADGSSAT
jgi:alkylated DNA nucleotide flippase Atl1